MNKTYKIRFGTFAIAMGSGLSLFAQTPEAPLPDPSGMDKVKFVSLSIPPPSQNPPETALRIWFVTLHHVVPPYPAAPSIPFTLFEGQSVWVGPPGTYRESSTSPVTFTASMTQCTPHYQDWSSVGLLHITGAHIVPSSVFQVEQVPISCQGQEDDCPTVSPVLELRTRRWSDVETPYSPPSPTTQPDLADCSALINKFRGVNGAPLKVRAQIAVSNSFGEITVEQLSNNVGFESIAASVDGFRCFRYPGQMGKCASSSSACTAHEDCGANGPCELYCPD